MKRNENRQFVYGFKTEAEFYKNVYPCATLEDLKNIDDFGSLHYDDHDDWYETDEEAYSAIQDIIDEEIRYEEQELEAYYLESGAVIYEIYAETGDLHQIYEYRNLFEDGKAFFRHFEKLDWYERNISVWLENSDREDVEAVTGSIADDKYDDFLERLTEEMAPILKYDIIEKYGSGSWWDNDDPDHYDAVMEEALENINLDDYR